LAEKILKEFKQDVEAMTLIPSGGGRFEVTLDGELVYSKLKEGRFPEYGEVQAHVQKRVG